MWLYRVSPDAGSCIEEFLCGFLRPCGSRDPQAHGVYLNVSPCQCWLSEGSKFPDCSIGTGVIVVVSPYSEWLFNGSKPYDAVFSLADSPYPY